MRLEHGNPLLSLTGIARLLQIGSCTILVLTQRGYVISVCAYGVSRVVAREKAAKPSTRRFAHHGFEGSEPVHDVEVGQGGA